MPSEEVTVGIDPSDEPVFSPAPSEFWGMPAEYPAGGPEGPPELPSVDDIGAIGPDVIGPDDAGAGLVFDATVVELSLPPQPQIEAIPIAPQRAHPETLNFRFMDES